MSKDNGWVWALAVVFGIAGAIWLIVTVCQAIQAFYIAQTFWFWFIVAVIVISPICFLLRFKIRNTIYNIFYRNKPNNNNITGNQKNK